MTQPASGSEVSPLSLAGTVGLAVLVVGGLLTLIILGKDTTSYTVFLAGPLVTSVAAAVINRRVRAVEAVAQEVKSQTNGQLSNQFVSVHAHLDEQTSEIIAAGPAAGSPTLPAAGGLPSQRDAGPVQQANSQPLFRPSSTGSPF